MDKKKSQAAMEFLTTYGWAILIVLVVVVMLSYFGVLDFGKLAPRRCVLEVGIGCMDFKVQEDSVTLVLKNSKGEDITISSVTVGSCTGTGSGFIKNEEQAHIIVYGCDNTVNERFDEEVNLVYTGESGLEHATVGSVKGKVTEGVIGEGGEEEGGEDGLDLPPGMQRYFFRSNPTSPQIYEAIIDPLDVHPGDTQIMIVKARDTEFTIISVTAAIETDNGIRNEALSLVSGDTWEGSWVVYDTHSATYRTTFTAENSNGESTSATLTWSDPCTPPAGGDWTLDDNCGITGVHGVDNGDFIVGGSNPTSGSNAITINAGAIFVWNPGKTIFITNGTIIMSDSGKLRKGYLWLIDVDADGNPASTTMYFGNTETDACPSSDCRRRKDLNSYTSTDTNDADACADTSTTHVCGTASGGNCNPKAAGEQGLSACQRCDGSSIDAANIADNTQDTEGSNTCSGTCKNCNGAGSCVNQGVEDLFGQCGTGNCGTGNCGSGTGACGWLTTGDGNCAICKTCVGVTSTSCVNVATYSTDAGECTGSTGCENTDCVCDGSGNCDIDNTFNCAGDAQCASGDCNTQPDDTWACTDSSDKCADAAGAGRDISYSVCVGTSDFTCARESIYSGTDGWDSVACTNTCQHDGDGTYSDKEATCSAAACDALSACGAAYACSGAASKEDGNDCATSCSSNDDDYCASGYTCESTTCTAELADGNSCDEDADCANSNCRLEIDGGGYFCAGAGKECSNSGAVGYDTGGIEGSYMCLGSDSVLQCAAGTQCDEYNGYYCDGAGTWTSGSSNGVDAACTACKACGGTASNNEGDLSCVNAGSGTDPGYDCDTTNCNTGNCDGDGACGYYTSGQRNCGACKVCDGSGNCGSTSDTNWNQNLYGCTGSNRCSSGSCITCTSTGGWYYSGYCWYYGSLGQSCNTVCSGRGSCDSAGIIACSDMALPCDGFTVVRHFSGDNSGEIISTTCVPTYRPGAPGARNLWHTSTKGDCSCSSGSYQRVCSCTR